MNFALRLKEERERKGLSQAALAKEIGVGVSTIGMWESTSRIPSAKTLNKLLKFFGCSLDYLLGNSDQREAIEAKHTTYKEYEISPQEAQLLEGFRALSSSTQEALLRVLENFLEIEKRA